MATEKIEAINAEIEKTKTEIRQLENRAKRLSGSHSQLERKARTRRLIERGAILESLIPEAETLTNEQIRSLLKLALSSTVALSALKNLNAQSNGNSSLV